MTDYPNTSLRKRALRQILKTVVLSPQSLLLLFLGFGMFALNVSFLGMPASMWLVFAAIAEIIYIGSVMTDGDAVGEIVKEMFGKNYSIETIRNPRSRQRLLQAIEYVHDMKIFTDEQRGALQQHLLSSLNEMDVWLEQMYTLARRIDIFEENQLLIRDRQRVPDELKRLHRRFDTETDPKIKFEIEQAIRIKQTQLENLQVLETNIKRAELQLENTLSALGTVYTQMQVMGSKDVDGQRSHRLRENIQNEIMSLRDTIDAIDDVQQASNFYAASS